MRANRLRRENNSRRRAVTRKRRQRIIERREKWFRIVNREGAPKISSVTFVSRTTSHLT